jgi:hypothetical protein
MFQRTRPGWRRVRVRGHNSMTRTDLSAIARRRLAVVRFMTRPAPHPITAAHPRAGPRGAACGCGGAGAGGGGGGGARRLRRRPAALFVPPRRRKRTRAAGARPRVRAGPETEWRIDMYGLATRRPPFATSRGGET